MVAGKIKKCKVCKTEYRQFRSMDKVCSLDCAVALAKQQTQAEADKAIRKDTQRRKEKIKTKSDWAREAQKEFNAYIRERDKGKPCISCGKPDDGTHQRHASHYRSVGACSALRFNTLNVWASCAQCNATKSGNLIEYRIRLNEFIPGLPDYLESVNDIVRYDIDYLKRLKSIFRRRARHIKNIRERNADKTALKILEYQIDKG